MPIATQTATATVAADPSELRLGSLKLRAGNEPAQVDNEANGGASNKSTSPEPQLVDPFNYVVSGVERVTVRPR